MTLRTFTFEHYSHNDDIGYVRFEVDVNVIVARDPVSGERWLDDWNSVGNWSQSSYTHQQVIDLLDVRDLEDFALKGEPE